jgi:3',5'-cyclic AMP phosphodiesterase CpdA
MKILHITDAHFGNEKPAFELHLLKDAFLEYRESFARDDTYLVVSGDVTFKGQPEGYKEALKFFNEIWIDSGGARDRFIACPGNHDICDKKFEAFDAFVSGIRRDNLLNYSKSTANIVELPGATFLLVNSAAHADAEYGFIDINEMKRKLEIEKENRVAENQRIAVVHHNIFGLHKMDTSAIRNSLAFVSLLDEHKFNVILHGHQHAQTVVSVGRNRMELFAGRSLNFSTKGFVNGMAEMTFEGKDWAREIKVLSHDNAGTGQLKFKSMEM